MCLVPKLAKDYDSRYYESERNSTYSNTYDFNKYFSSHNNSYENLRKSNKPLKRTKKRKSLGQVIISLLFLSFLLCQILPFSYSKVTKAIFVPTPHKHIKADLHSLAFPTHNYISNNWYFGQRDFNFSQTGKKAEMFNLKENVNMPALRQQLMNLGELYPQIKPSIYVWDYNTGNYVDINANANYPTASIIKLPVLVDVFKSIDANQFSINDKIPLKEYYRTEGSGNLQFKAQMSQYTVDELARRMITDSDNSATNMLMAKVGSMTDVNQQIRNWGLKNTYIKNWLPDLEGTNRTTAKEMATILYNIDENDKLLSESSRAKILDYMGHVHNNRLIQAGLGAGSVFLHKTGDIGTMLGDAGIVIAPDGSKYIIVIMVTRSHNDIAGKDYIVKASKIIYDYMVK